MVVTAFLAVLVLAFFLGNVFLSLASPKRMRKQLEKELGLLPDNGSGLLPARGTFQGLSENQVLEKASFEQRLSSEKLSHLNKRVDRLEQVLLKLSSSKAVAKNLRASNLSRKMDDYVKFKERTRLEIAALKQRLDKVQPSSKKRGRGPEISDEKLRDIVFRASH